jgi:hypothetical protein
VSDLNIGDKVLLVPRGTIGLEPMRLDMTMIYLSESRLREVAIATPRTAPELLATYNETANELTKYISWVKYEKLRAEKELGLARAEVIIDKIPEHAKKLKEAGAKMNEDYRDALVARDPRCAELQEKLNAIEAILALLESKFWSFIRAFNATQMIANLKDGTITSNMNATPGMLDNSDSGFMGQSRY